MRENRLTSGVTEADYIPAIEETGARLGTRARRFYELAGWTHIGMLANGEALFEMKRP